MSKFADWQKIRIQESSTDIPPGSMPRTMDIIVRNDATEIAKPGDLRLFTGAFVVMPDVAKLMGSSVKLSRGEERSKHEGIYGLDGMGVRDLTYKTGFLACSVEDANNRVSIIMTSVNLSLCLR